MKDGPVPAALPSQHVSDPRLAAYYRDRPGHEAQFSAHVEQGVLETYRLGRTSVHPYVVAARVAARPESSPEDVASIFREYYARVQPASALAWLDLTPTTCPALAHLPPVPALLPWSVLSVEEHLSFVERVERSENAVYKLDEGGSAGWKTFGPVSDAKIMVEVERTSALVTSIARHGLDHQRATYTLFATVLVADGRWRWLSRGGTHRAAVACAMGIDPLPMRVGSIIRREEVELWPQVRSGTFERGAALAVFDRLFEGRPPEVANEWSRWVRAKGI